MERQTKYIFSCIFEKIAIMFMWDMEKYGNYLKHLSKYFLTGHKYIIFFYKKRDNLSVMNDEPIDLEVYRVFIIIT